MDTLFSLSLFLDCSASTLRLGFVSVVKKQQPAYHGEEGEREEKSSQNNWKWGKQEGTWLVTDFHLPVVIHMVISESTFLTQWRWVVFWEGPKAYLSGDYVYGSWWGKCPWARFILYLISVGCGKNSICNDNIK